MGKRQFRQAGAVGMEMAALRLEGNVIPISWYSEISRTKNRTIHRGKGKPPDIVEVNEPDYIAINLLAEAVYWHRPKEIRSKKTNATFYHQKFHGEKWQVNYSTLLTKLGITKTQAKEAMDFLEKLGLGKKSYKQLSENVFDYRFVYFEVAPKRIAEISYRLGKAPINLEDFDDEGVEEEPQEEDATPGRTTGGPPVERPRVPPVERPHISEIIEETTRDFSENASAASDFPNGKGWGGRQKAEGEKHPFPYQPSSPPPVDIPRPRPRTVEPEESPIVRTLTHPSGRTYTLRADGNVIPTRETNLWAMERTGKERGSWAGASIGEGDNVLTRFRLIGKEAEELKAEVNNGATC